jgi:hypothetical protein
MLQLNNTILTLKIDLVNFELFWIYLITVQIDYCFENRIQSLIKR